MKHPLIAVMVLAGWLVPATALANATPQPKDGFTLFDVQLVCLPIEALFDGDADVADYGVKESEQTPKVWANDVNEIIFSRGMLDFVQSRDEVAFLCAREIANITAGRFRGHTLKDRMLEVARWTMDGPGDEVAELFFHKRSRRLALAADEKAVLAMWQAGYDPMAATALWQRSPENKSQGSLKWVQGSPSGKDRLALMQRTMVEACEDGEFTAHCGAILTDPAHQRFRTTQATASTARDLFDPVVP